MTAQRRLEVATKLAPALAGGLAAGAIAVGLATPASADYDTSGYVNALDAAGLIDHDGDPCNIVNGLCHGQFDDGPSAVSTGVWVCQHPSTQSTVNGSALLTTR